ncbi:enoyl-ACP reductase FabV [Entomospira culicis]|uniref:Trans-2-enoyl-CoA reductase [NADH] n=1 Tax=Entomospira culicis TaxID=2719989 RepID=A0A968GGC3_9SPIO|nr:enoyl-ACP reductase FabV [Entomospira culicis]NIZ19303.1 trans-2-enoyl-CoA reductase family protein [Entomospira culicis]NIZ69792.1 trans-2-enoyl-CoA reductase family protein [Entomospira culicis]WDI37970.1 trans-2-enoyl-CoA reductase family protein [Entomospira culicis]WDI39593.1 trans-2-enoyl-CoA reductase family protein [Entomospira culicis]
MIIEPKVAGNVCLNAHPTGALRLVEELIDFAKKQPKIAGPKRVLVIGASAGYGLATRIINTYVNDATTIGVSFERAGSADKVGAVGWYNNLAFSKLAKADGKQEMTLSGDAFSQACKDEVIATAKELFKGEKIDLVVYSLASPMRTAPDGITYKSVLKPTGQPYTGKTVNIFNAQVSEVTIEPASEEEAKNTVKVMGGEDWILWIEALKAHDLLAAGAITMAYSYIGPEMTYPLYREGTIGKAKEHLEQSVGELNSLLASLNGKAYVSVNKAVMTRASSVIPVVPLYMAILYKLMKAKGTHEGTIEQAYRLMDRLYNHDTVLVDDVGRIRLDDWEMDRALQKEIELAWNNLDLSRVREETDLEGIRKEFMQIHGFEVDGVDYSQEVDPSRID